PPPATHISPLSLHDALPISSTEAAVLGTPTVFLDINGGQERYNANLFQHLAMGLSTRYQKTVGKEVAKVVNDEALKARILASYEDRKSTRLNSSHLVISYAV